MPQLPIQNPNQFSMAPVVGMQDLRFNFNSFDVKINPDSETLEFPVGSVLKLIAGTSAVPLVDLAEDTDEPFCVIGYQTKKNIWLPGDIVQVYGDGSVLYLTFSAATDRGSVLGFNSTNQTVAEVAGTDAILGIALDQPTATGQVARVMIKTAAGAAS